MMIKFLEKMLLMAMMLCALHFLSCSTPMAHAAIVSSGDVVPADPTTWTSNTYGYIGQSSTGIITVDDGSGMQSDDCYLGYNSSATGTATVIGTGSKWTNDGLYVGYSGSGSLNIAAGGQVSSSYAGYLGYNSGATGTATVTGTGSMWTNDFLYVGCSGSGSLNIAAGGQVSSYRGCLGYASGAKGTVTVTDIGTKWTTRYNIYVGNAGSGSLNIEDGGQVSNDYGYLGYNSGATGTATVTGTGSKWINSASLYIGYYGSGNLNIEAGGEVSNTYTYIGFRSGSTGMATITGIGSMWTINAPVTVGYSGSGTLNVNDGGTVTASNIDINNSKSLLAIDVGTGSKLTLSKSSAAFINSGTVRFLAGVVSASNSNYMPISANWNGSTMGIVQAVGGVWNVASHDFTVSGVQAGDSGVPVTVDLLSTQRLLIGDSGSGWTLGASFAASASAKPLTLTATAIGDGTLTALENLAGPGQDVLGGWNLSATSGYAAGDPVYLSFDTGGIYSREFLQLWSYDGSSWTKFAASDVNFDGKYVNFTATSLGGYAVTVPEPGTVVLLSCGLLGMGLAEEKTISIPTWQPVFRIRNGFCPGGAASCSRDRKVLDEIDQVF